MLETNSNVFDKQVHIHPVFDQVDNFLLVDQWASLASSAPTATLSDITQGVFYSVKLEYKERFLAQVDRLSKVNRLLQVDCSAPYTLHPPPLLSIFPNSPEHFTKSRRGSRSAGTMRVTGRSRSSRPRDS